MRTDKRSTVFDPAPALIRPVFGPVSVYPIKNENERKNTVYGCRRNGIYPVRFQLTDLTEAGILKQPPRLIEV